MSQRAAVHILVLGILVGSCLTFLLWFTVALSTARVSAQTGPASCVLDGVTYPAGSYKYERYSNASGLAIAQRQAAYWKGGWWVDRERERWYTPIDPRRER